MNCVNKKQNKISFQQVSFQQVSFQQVFISVSEILTHDSHTLRSEDFKATF